MSNIVSLFSVASSTQTVATNKSSAGDGDQFEALLAQLDSANSRKPHAASTGSGADLSSLFSIIQGLPTDTAQSIGNLLPGGNANTAASGLNPDYSTDFGQSVLAGLGPLPAFLKQVTSAYGLSAEQAKTLQDIAVSFQDAPAGAQTVAQISDALQAAGLPA